MQRFEFVDTHTNRRYHTYDDLNMYSRVVIWLQYFMIKALNLIPWSHRMVAVGDMQDFITFDNSKINLISDSG